MIDVPDLEPGRAKSPAVARYIRAALKVQALRREFARALVEMKACKKVLSGRTPANNWMAEAQALCEEFHIEAANR